MGLLQSVYNVGLQREALVHRGVTCNECKMSPIRGMRFKCGNCADLDLCESCMAAGAHTPRHVFAAIRIPIPALTNPRTVLFPPLYPGTSATIPAIPDEEQVAALTEVTHCKKTKKKTYESRNLLLHHPSVNINEIAGLSMQVSGVTLHSAL